MAKPGSIKWDAPASETLGDIGDLNGWLTLRQWARAQKQDGVSLAKIAAQVGCAGQTLDYAIKRPDTEGTPVEAPVAETGQPVGETKQPEGETILPVAETEPAIPEHVDCEMRCTDLQFTEEHGETGDLLPCCAPEATDDDELLPVPVLEANLQAAHQERVARLDAQVDAERVRLVQAEEAAFRSFIRRQDLEDEFDGYVAGWMDREEAMA